MTETRAERFEREVPVIYDIIDARIAEVGSGEGASLAAPGDTPSSIATTNSVGISSKAARSDHSHSGVSVTDLNDALATKANTSHTHSIDNITGLDSAINGKQPLDSDLTTIAALTPSNNDLLQRKSGAWINRSVAQVKTDLQLAAVATTGSYNDLSDKPATATFSLVEKYYQDEYGIYSITGPPLTFMASSTWGATDHNISLMFVPAGKAINGVCVAIRTNASYAATSAPSQVKIYDTSGTLVGSSPDSNTMALSKGWSTQTLSSPIAAQGSDRYVYIGVSLGGFAGASLAWPTAISTDLPEFVSTGSIIGRRRAFYASNSAGLPNSFNPSSYGTTTSYIPLIGLV